MPDSRIHKKDLFGLLLLVFIAVSPATTACELKIAWEPWPPYQQETDAGEVSGLDGDLLGAIVGEMDCTITWVQSTWKRSLQGVESGEISAVMSAIRTEDRAAWGRYSDVYRQSANHLVLGNDLEGQYDSLEDFLAAGNKLGIVKEYNYGNQVMALIADDQYKMQIRDTLAADANMKRVASGRVDGVLMDVFVASNLKREMSLADKIAASSIEVSSEDLHVLFSKASVDQQTVDDFNSVLARLRAEGALQILFDQYSQ
jgi:polar amino acid transport system substrate-binding protein